VTVRWQYACTSCTLAEDGAADDEEEQEL